MSYLQSIAENCGLNILLALSVYATFMVGQFSLAQVGFMSIGAYTTGILIVLYGVPLLPSLLVLMEKLSLPASPISARPLQPD